MKTSLPSVLDFKKYLLIDPKCTPSAVYYWVNMLICQINVFSTQKTQGQC